MSSVGLGMKEVVHLVKLLAHRLRVHRVVGAVPTGQGHHLGEDSVVTGDTVTGPVSTFFAEN